MSSSSSFIPITPFIGVRISWLTLARNADFMFDASTASSRATASSAAARVALGHVVEERDPALAPVEHDVRRW